jgi:hypothetical protein
VIPVLYSVLDRKAFAPETKGTALSPGMAS